MTTETYDGTMIENGTDPGAELEPWEAPRATVVYREQERDLVDGWVEHAASVFRLADYIAPTDFVPRVMRNNPAAVAACILAGRELGLGPMTSLRHVQVVEGSPSLSAEYKRARVLSKGHQFQIAELTTTRCRIVARRKGFPDPLEITFTIEDARRANLVKPRGAWDTRPRRMLFARASSEVCDFMFSDLVNGLPTTELLLEGEYDELTGIANETAAPEDTATPHRAQRKTPAGARQRRAGSPERHASGVTPPLPGEERDAGPAVPGRTGEAGSAPDDPDAVAASPGADPPTPTPDPGFSTDRGTPGGADATAANGSTSDASDPPDKAPMLKKIQALFGSAFGIKGRAEKLRAVSALAGRTVASSQELTFTECIAVIDAMEQAAAAPQETERAERLWVIVNAWERSQAPPTDDEPPL